MHIKKESNFYVDPPSCTIQAKKNRYFLRALKHFFLVFPKGRSGDRSRDGRMELGVVQTFARVEPAEKLEKSDGLSHLWYLDISGVAFFFSWEKWGSIDSFFSLKVIVCWFSEGWRSKLDRYDGWILCPTILERKEMWLHGGTLSLFQEDRDHLQFILYTKPKRHITTTTLE